MSVLEERGLNFKLKEWHVLQILKDGLKVELDSLEYWYQGFAMGQETLQIDNHKIQMLDLPSLKEFYKRGMEDAVNKTEENEKRKYEALRAKYNLLAKMKE